MSREIRIGEEGRRTQLTLPGLSSFGVRSLVFGEVCVAGEGFAANWADVKADS